MSKTISLVQFTDGRDPDGPPRLGLMVEGRILNPGTSLPWSSVLELLRSWDTAQGLLQDLDWQSLPEVPHASLVAPITYPHKVFCAGANYYQHAEEMDTDRPDPRSNPFFFLKSPTTTIIGPNDDVTVHDLEALNLDWEAELAVVIGRQCSRISPEDAMSVVAGYMVSNDLSARAHQKRPGAVAPAFEWDWVSAKNQDGSCPTGPGLVPAWFIDDPHDLGIRLSVNATVKQDGSTADMVVKVPELVAAASRISTLEPGDIILTGTPSGVGAPNGDFLHHGDEVVVEIERLGSIRHTIRAATTAPGGRVEVAASVAGT